MCENFRREKNRKIYFKFVLTVNCPFKKNCLNTYLMLYLGKYYRYVNNLNCNALYGHEAKAVTTVYNKSVVTVHCKNGQK